MHNKTELTLEADKRENFNIEPGVYRAQVKAVFELPESYKDQTDTSIRIKWRILEPASPLFEYIVAKRYPCSLKQHSALWKDLVGWFGVKGLERRMPDGTFVLSSLIDEKADIQVANIDNGREDAYVYPKRIAAPGTLLRNHGLETGDPVLSPGVAQLRRNFN